MEILRVSDLKKTYGKGDTAVEALKGINLSVQKGEFIAIVGTSGSGKSTLLHMLGGLDRPTSGSVSIDGKDIFTLKDEELTIFRRRKIGFVFQSFNLVPVLSVYENIVLPIELDGNVPDKEFVDQIPWGSQKRGMLILISFPEDSNSVLQLQERYLQHRRSFWQTSPQETLIQRQARMSWGFLRSLGRSIHRPSS